MSSDVLEALLPRQMSDQRRSGLPVQPVLPPRDASSLPPLVNCGEPKVIQKKRALPIVLSSPDDQPAQAGKAAEGCSQQLRSDQAFCERQGEIPAKRLRFSDGDGLPVGQKDGLDFISVDDLKAILWSGLRGVSGMDVLGDADDVVEDVSGLHDE